MYMNYKNIFAAVTILSFLSAQTAFAQAVPDSTAAPAVEVPAAEAPADATPPIAQQEGGDVQSVEVPVIETIDTTSTTSAGDAQINQDANPSSEAVQNTASDDVAPTATSTVPVQESLNSQDAASSTAIFVTADPQAALGADVILTTATDTPVITATTSDASATSTPENPTNVQQETPIDDAPVLDVVGQVADTPQDTGEITETPIQQQADVPAIPLVQSKEDEPEFSFSLTGKKISTVRQVKMPDGKTKEETVSTDLTPSVDNTTGTLSFSGTCSAEYYVVLLFKNQDDYKNDPRSYVVNRAYPCTNNSFTYALSDLPEGLPNGIYYLLIGEQSKKTPWKPITEMTEVTINAH